MIDCTDFFFSSFILVEQKIHQIMYEVKHNSNEAKFENQEKQKLHVNSCGNRSSKANLTTNTNFNTITIN